MHSTAVKLVQKSSPELETMYLNADGPSRPRRGSRPRKAPWYTAAVYELRLPPSK